MLVDEATLIALRDSCVKYLSYRGYGQNAEDVAQNLVCEAYRQPGTQRLINQNAQAILQGRLPSLLRRRVCSDARAINSGWIQIKDDETVDIEDETTSRDQERMDASLDALNLARRHPLLSQMLDAFREGDRTRKDVAKHLGRPERTFYEMLRRVRGSIRCD